MTAGSEVFPCAVCGFDEALYGLESDIASTAELASEVTTEAAAGLSEDELAATPTNDRSIAEWLASVEEFEGSALETAHNGLHAMAEIGLLRDALGRGPVSSLGEVTGLHTSGGGVPKTASSSVEVKRSGVVGDAQNNRIHHGRPLQALCVWSNDVIEALQDEGHPITPGLAGENVTVSGIDWSLLRPGSRITVSDIPVLISSYAVPCSNVAPGFTDRNFRRILHTDNEGWSRLYGIPLGEGSVSLGDEVSV